MHFLYNVQAAVIRAAAQFTGSILNISGSMFQFDEPPSGSPWADKITLAILDYHESGFMEELDNKWILQQKQSLDCKDKDGNNPVTLGLENMRGVSRAPYKGSKQMVE